MTGRPNAALVLESGRVFRGRQFGAAAGSAGEVVFNTAMTGYQEIATDPSYAGQIVVMTAPQMGNTGVNPDDEESAAPACAGLVVRELSALVSSWRAEAERDLEAYLADHGVAGLEGVDTRALTRAIREGGAQRGAIVVGEDADAPAEELRERARRAPEMEGLDLAGAVSCREPYAWRAGPWRMPGDDRPPETAPPPEVRVVAYDFGIKRNILRELVAAGCSVEVVPASTPAAEALARDADGYLLSNGPGDPAAVGYAIDAVKGLLDAEKPIFGICLGHQILALAAGARTFKLPHGHHGANHPVRDLSTGKVEITSHNHGFAVARDALPAGVEATHMSLYDDTVEGLRFVDRPVFGVQYHPEARPGPRDAGYLFGRFVSAARARARRR